MGIGGYGMNPIARVLHAQGYDVSGCDLNESPLVGPLRELGIPIEIGHDPAHLDDYQPDALVISSAIPADNAEVAGESAYPEKFAVALARPNVFAVQFHPEKSQAAGLQLYRDFLGWDGSC